MGIMKLLFALLATLSLSVSIPAADATSARSELISVRKIWDQAPHNAFTDLIRYKGEWFCVFREGKGHVSPDGKLRIIRSRDGDTWTSAALIASSEGDLRDAKITMTPSGELMLSGAVALPQPSPITHRSLAWFSRDGATWSEPNVIGDTNQWLWRTTWHKDTAYSVGYETKGEKSVRLYSSKNGRIFDPLVPRLFDEGYPNESSIVFLPDDTALCLLRRDGNPASGKLGAARPPYTAWEWKDLGVKIGGPHLLRLPDGRLVSAVRLYDGKVRTSLAWIDADTAKLTEFLSLPSGGDCSYAGLVFENGLLWVTYYSSHEGKTSIYLAKVKLSPN